MDLVEKQYTSWVYPFPVDDMEEAIRTGEYIEVGDPTFEWPRFWPHKRKVGKLDILIAGCGTNQAAYYACRNPSWNVIGVDLSEASIAHQKKLKEKHNLQNLRLEKLNLLDISSLKLSYDFIVSSGVLHHLPNPDDGLQALRGVLRPEGVMSLMVYSTSLRLGIYMMQEVFRQLHFRQTKEDIDLVKATIESLHPEHVLKRYIKDCKDIKYDAGIVDTFLHPQDKSYYVNEIFDFTRKAGLEFISWVDPIDYSLEDHMPAKHPLWKKIANIPLETKYHICDLLVQERGTHRWIAAHPEYAKKIQISLDKMSIIDCTLILNPKTKILRPSLPQEKANAYCQRLKTGFEIHFILAQILEKLHAKNSIKAVIDQMYQDDKERRAIYELVANEVIKLYQSGHLYILLPEDLRR